MGDPNWRYGASADRASIPRASFPVYLPSEQSTMASHHPYNSNDLFGSSSDYLQKDILPVHRGAYGVDNVVGVGVRADPSLGGLPDGAGIKSYPSPLEDPSLFSEGRNATHGIGSGTTNVMNDRPGSLRQADGLPAATRELNILFVDGLPNDCLRREVGQIFFVLSLALENLELSTRSPDGGGDKAMVLCFVEFTDAKCALTAMEALQGYKFDERKPDSPVLRIHSAHFSFRLPSDQ